jgi:hypothetical protein
MSVSQDPQPPRHEGAIGAVTDLGGRLIGALPPAMILLALINIGFIGALIWFLNDQLEQRNRMAEQLFHRCLEVALHDTP